MIMDTEKYGGNIRTTKQLSIGRKTLDVCGLIGLGFDGYKYTWTNGRKRRENIQCRLDRSLANEDFIRCFTLVKVSHLPRFGSDHIVIRIELGVVWGEGRRHRQ